MKSELFGPQVYPLQGEFLDTYNAEYQVINNTQPSGVSPAAVNQGYSTVDVGSGLLTSASLSTGMMNAAHTMLDLGGTIERIGTVADLGNAGLYAWEGDYKSATVSGVAALPLFGLGATLWKWGNKAIDVGTTVLGSYNKVTGGYVTLAKQLDAHYFEIPTHIWNGMTDAERWGANTKFLDRTILRGDNIILSNSALKANPVHLFIMNYNIYIQRGIPLLQMACRLSNLTNNGKNIRIRKSRSALRFFN